MSNICANRLVCRRQGERASVGRQAAGGSGCQRDQNPAAVRRRSQSESRSAERKGSVSIFLCYYRELRCICLSCIRTKLAERLSCLFYAVSTFYTVRHIVLQFQVEQEDRRAQG